MLMCHVLKEDNFIPEMKLPSTKIANILYRMYLSNHTLILFVNLFTFCFTFCYINMTHEWIFLIAIKYEKDSLGYIHKSVIPSQPAIMERK